jgi:hypothetical protein
MGWRVARLFASVPLLAVLAGCAGTFSDQIGESFWVSPGKYEYHSCLQGQAADRGFASRQTELEELMARAAQGAGGQAIGQIVYRSEYQQVLGERKALAAMFREKRCQIEGDSKSGRSVF